MSKKRRYVMCAVLFVMSALLLSSAIIYRQNQLDPLERPRKIMVYDYREAPFFSESEMERYPKAFISPQKLGITSREINRILIKLIREDPNSRDYFDKWNKVQSECIIELKIWERASKFKLFPIAIVDAANLTLSYVFGAIGIVLGIASIILFFFGEQVIQIMVNIRKHL